MTFVAIADGKILAVHDFRDENGRSVTVNGASYLAMLEDFVWPAIQDHVEDQELWWMQDGAPPHCTQAVLSFLREKFDGRVISRRTPVPWPAHSPDLNILDFHFWAEAQKKVFEEKPSNLEDLVSCVRRFSDQYDPTVIKKSCANTLKRARACLSAEGGHFQHFL